MGRENWISLMLVFSLHIDVIVSKSSSFLCARTTFRRIYGSTALVEASGIYSTAHANEKTVHQVIITYYK